MTAPRLEIRLDRIAHNTTSLVVQLAGAGVAVTGVSKATLGSPDVARTMLAAGVAGLGESRVENVERLRRGGITAHVTLVRSPMPSQIDRVVASADASLNTEPEVVDLLSRAALGLGLVHGVVLMVELGDLREGLLPRDLAAAARQVEQRDGVALLGIGTNLACQNGIAPDQAKMDELSRLVVALELDLGRPLDVVSGGNSANLGWLLGGGEPGRVNDLRLGEALLLGVDPLDRSPIDGLDTSAFRLVAEVIESKVKPSVAWGDVRQGAFGPTAPPVDRGDAERVVLALGRQDVDLGGLRPPDGMTVLGASSDHLVLDPGGRHCAVGSEVSFELDYAALLAAMTSAFVTKVVVEPTGV